MSQLREGYPELELEVKEQQLTVSLKANQFKLQELDQYKIFLEGTADFFEGSLAEASEERLVLTYDLGEEAQTLTAAAADRSVVDRLLLAQKLQFLSQYADSLVQPYLHPDNLFALGDAVKAAHRGFASGVSPYAGEDKSYFEAYRALILYLLNPKLAFTDLIKGSAALKNPFSQEIQQAEDFNSLNQALETQAALQAKKRAADSVYVPKQRFQIYKWGMLVFAILALALAIATGIYALHTVPYQDRLVSAEIHFTTQDYAKALAVLKKDNPRQMPRGTQYALAVSAIQLDTLSQKQKANILKNISVKTNENVLLYWTYIGFGDLDKTLDLAQNIGDSQLILHAYRKLYNQVTADTEMKGAEKQEKLKEYREQIQNYEEMLGGKDNHDEK